MTQKKLKIMRIRVNLLDEFNYITNIYKYQLRKEK